MMFQQVKKLPLLLYIMVEALSNRHGEAELLKDVED